MTNQLHLPPARNGFSEQEDAVVDMLRRAMTEAKRGKAHGKLTIEVDYNDGGIVGKWVGSRYKEK